MSKSKKTSLEVPECWSDDVRMDVLFSPFRLRKVNPENYDAKLKFWEDMLLRLCEYKGSPCFSIREAMWAFERKNKLPHGIETVVDELIAKKALRPCSDFINDPKNTWSGWLMKSLYRRPLQWTLPKLQTPSEPRDVPYIHLEALKVQSKTLMRSMEKMAGSIASFDKIAEICDPVLNKEGLFLNLLHLQSLEKVFLEYKCIDGKQRIHLVKFGEKEAKVQPITAADKAVYALEQTEEGFLKALENIESEIVKYDQQARENVRLGKRVVAKTYLKKKHYLEKKLDKHCKALDNIQILLSRIHETRSNELILDAYSIGSETLKALLINSKLNINNVDEIVDTIKESFEIQEEVEQSLSNVLPEDKAEEEALEDELEVLMQDVTTSDESQALLAKNKSEELHIDKLPIAANEPSVNKVEAISDTELMQHLEKIQIEFDSFSIANNVEQSKI